MARRNRRRALIGRIGYRNPSVPERPGLAGASSLRPFYQLIFACAAKVLRF